MEVLLSWITPRKAKKRRHSSPSTRSTDLNDSEPLIDGEDQPVEAAPLTNQELKRLKVCILIEYGFSISEACRLVGVNKSGFIRGKWNDKFQKYGQVGILTPKRKRNKTVMTPRTKAECDKQAKLGKDSKEIQTGLIDFYEERGDNDRSIPHMRTIQKELKKSHSYVRKMGRLFVKAPWTARWRRQFADDMLRRLKLPRTDPDHVDPRDIIFMDEKKCCLYDSNFGLWWPDDADYNVARDLNMTDEEYLDWRSDNKSKVLPHTKQRGKFPLFIWGAVGYNMKSELHFLKPAQGKQKKETLKKENYREILREKLGAMLQQRGRRARLPNPSRLFSSASETLGLSARAYSITYVTQDNDSKHYNTETNQLIKDLGFRILGTFRMDPDGNPDRVPHGTPGNAGFYYKLYPFEDGERFPAYSPDLNGVIEKCWRELQRRYMARAAEINSFEDMQRVIIEEWEGLEFDENPNNKNGWHGINYMVDKFEKICTEVKDKNGWDTKYIK